MIRTLLAALAALGIAIAHPAAAQPYPNRPVKIIVPTPAGGPVDVMARILANALPPFLGQNVIVENRAGAGNTLGSKAAAAADPDGYTLLVSAASGLIMSPMVYKSAGYDENSFAPIALITETPQVLVAYPGAPFNSVAELVAYAKANPGKLNYSTGGAGTLPHLTAELFKQLSGTDIVHVPYKGGGPALTDVVAGQVPMTFDTAGTSLQFIREGKLKALAVSNPTRLAELPERADHAGARLCRHQQRRLGGAARAARHAAGDPRAAQPGRQRGAGVAADEGGADAPLRAAARRHAGRPRPAHEGRARQMGADRRQARAEGRLTHVPQPAAR